MPWNMPVDRLRQADLDLRRLAADVGQRQQQAGEQDAERMQPAEEGDDDGGEAVAGRDVGDELADRAGDLEQRRRGPRGRRRAAARSQMMPFWREAGEARGARAPGRRP